MEQLAFPLLTHLSHGLRCKRIGLQDLCILIMEVDFKSLHVRELFFSFLFTPMVNILSGTYGLRLYDHWRIFSLGVNIRVC